MTRQYPPLGVGGIGSYVATVASLLHDAGHDVTVLSAAPGAERRREEHDGVAIEWAPPTGPTFFWRWLHRRWPQPAPRLHAAVSAALALRRLPGRFDVIEAPEWKAESLALRWCRKGPLVVHLHLSRELVRRWNGDAPPGRALAAAEWMERRGVTTAHAVTATTRLSRTLPDGAPWLPDVEVAIVPPPIVVTAWSGGPPIEPTPPVVLFVGHLERRKAPEVVLDAVHRLAAEVAGLKVLFVGAAFPGPDGRPYDVYLREEADRLGVECEVRPPVVGRAAMVELYGSARVLAAPSRFETLSMVALEALACGRPVVLSSSVGAKEWLEGALPDLVVPPDDAQALADALRPLLLDVHLAAATAERGRAALEAACAVDQVVGRRVEVYESVAAS